MRNRRAAQHKLTLYELVRDPKLYPLERYLEAADMALAADPANLPIFVKNLTDPDAGMRWWAINGLKNLGSKAKSAQKQILHAAQHDATQEVRILAAWILHDFGNVDAYREVMDGIKKTGIKTKSHFETTVKLVESSS